MFLFPTEQYFLTMSVIFCMSSYMVWLCLSNLFQSYAVSFFDLFWPRARVVFSVGTDHLVLPDQTWFHFVLCPISSILVLCGLVSSWIILWSCFMLPCLLWSCLTFSQILFILFSLCVVLNGFVWFCSVVFCLSNRFLVCLGVLATCILNFLTTPDIVLSYLIQCFLLILLPTHFSLVSKYFKLFGKPWITWIFRLSWHSFRLVVHRFLDLFYRCRVLADNPIKTLPDNAFKTVGKKLEKM